MKGQVKRGRFVLGVIALVILGCAMLYVFRVTGTKAEITIDGVTLEMGTQSVREFMGDDYLFAIMSTEGNSLYMYNYTDAELEARTYYNGAVPFRPKDGYGAPIACWLYNPTSKRVDIRDGMICAVSCEVPELREYDIAVSVAGLELTDQSKEEIKTYMDDGLDGFEFSENKDVNAISYTRDKVSYTFRFDEADILQNAIAQLTV